MRPRSGAESARRPAVSARVWTPGPRPDRSTSAFSPCRLDPCSGPSGWERRKRRCAQPPERAQRPKQRPADWLVSSELDVTLPTVRRELRGQAEEPGPEPLGLRSLPAPLERRRADHVEKPVGHRRKLPEHAVAAHVVDGGPARAELDHLLDAVLDHGAGVVSAVQRHPLLRSWETSSFTHPVLQFCCDFTSFPAGEGLPACCRSSPSSSRSR